MRVLPRRVTSVVVASVVAVIGTLTLAVGSSSAAESCNPYTQGTLHFRVCIEPIGNSIWGTAYNDGGGTMNGHLELFKGAEPGASKFGTNGCTGSITSGNLCSYEWNPSTFNSYWHVSWVGNGGVYYKSPQIFD